MTILYLTEADVTRLLDIRLAIDVVEEAFKHLAAGEASNVPRQRAKAPGIVLHSMSATAQYLGLVGWKCYTTTKQGARFLAGLYDAQAGELIALIEADRLGQLRTGATTAVAAEAMAAPGAAETGLFGTGHQAETQLAAVAAVRKLKRAFVYSRSENKRIAFAQRMARELSIEIVPVDRPQEAAADLPIVITATTSTQPVFDGHDLSEGTFVAAVGSNWLTRAEIDATVVRRADNIVCDSVEACRHEAGDFVDALQKGVFDWSRAVDLAEVVAGRAVGRSRAESVTLFKSVGLAVEDVALGGKLIELARRDRVGRVVAL
ncbi:MAG TPA: ornithine cyclodeaminase family protein [Pirellulales bacterium]|jgi:ornithine cyclodeaminase/alanine dehydrogenase-like protein (mu-crystallin family)|nr:ornithine cyclodeaminase family protein [Pirellulales bacterium]